jgi:UDP-N-acetylglucosamine--N-acetylmuramyl-(pentapeptide) pyrophosphoryl-undecaprenol N-acetylglucosamine transferase
MAGGTGGHIFPALAIAERLRDLGLRVEWLGSRHGMETELIGKTDIPLHVIAASGLRGKSLFKLLLAPFMLLRALLQALQVMRRVRPGCVLGMGGFVTGPGGVAAWLSRVRLLIHEQNAIAGITNKLLSRIAYRVMEAFPGTFQPSARVLHTGNPVRRDIADLLRPVTASDRQALRLLILGGSQGAASINTIIPQVLQQWRPETRPEVVHQAGQRNLQATLDAYGHCGLAVNEHCDVRGFIDNIAVMYAWADLVIARSGASTVFELAAAGLPAILIPYPWHRDQQQLRNARWLADGGAALIVQQQDLTVAELLKLLSQLAEDRQRLHGMAEAAGRLAMRDADLRIARECLEAIND